MSTYSQLDIVVPKAEKVNIMALRSSLCDVQNKQVSECVHSGLARCGGSRRSACVEGQGWRWLAGGASPSDEGGQRTGWSNITKVGGVTELRGLVVQCGRGVRRWRVGQDCVQ